MPSTQVQEMLPFEKWRIPVTYLTKPISMAPLLSPMACPKWQSLNISIVTWCLRAIMYLCGESALGVKVMFRNLPMKSLLMVLSDRNLSIHQHYLPLIQWPQFLPFILTCRKLTPGCKACGVVIPFHLSHFNPDLLWNKMSVSLPMSIRTIDCARRVMEIQFSLSQIQIRQKFFGPVTLPRIVLAVLVTWLFREMETLLSTMVRLFGILKPTKTPPHPM